MAVDLVTEQALHPDDGTEFTYMIMRSVRLDYWLIIFNFIISPNL